jgi:hypothetical protein
MIKTIPETINRSRIGRSASSDPQTAKLIPSTARKANIALEKTCDAL